MYLTYDEYTDMGGTLDETTFSDYEFEAESVINWYTFDRLKDETKLPTEVKRCMNRLIQLAKMKADALALGMPVDGESSSTNGGTTAAIASQSNDGVSISYNVISASEIFEKLSSVTQGNELELTVQRYLQGVVNSLGRKVLYRGLYPGE